MPDDADPSVARRAPAVPRVVCPAALGGSLCSGLNTRGAQGLLDGDVDRVELMVASELLDEDPAAHVFEHGEVLDEVEEAPLVEHALDDHLKLGQARVGERLAGDGAPQLEPL